MTTDGKSSRSVSVVIPVRNEVAKIGQCLESILSQSIPVDEIIIVDSGSTDGTLGVIAGFPRTRVIGIEPQSFSHGYARNVGVRAAQADWVALTVGDAYAADDLWLQRLFDGILDDAVVGVCGSQIVPKRPDTNPVEWHNPLSVSGIRRFQYSSPQEFDALSPAEKKEACSWDDVTALYRRDVLLDLPFEPVMYGEDAIWAKAALRKGHALSYNPTARVNHYHNESAEFTFRRTIVTLCLRYTNFGFVDDGPDLLKTVRHVVSRLVRERDLTLRQRLKWARYNWTNQLSSRSAIKAFRAALQRGPAVHESFCRNHSGAAPVPLKVAAQPARYVR